MKRVSQFAVLTLLFTAASAGAQQAEPLKHLGPYLGDDSFVVAWIDVRNVDLLPFFARLEKLGVDKSDLDAMQAKYRSIKTKLTDAGATHVYATNLGTLPRPDAVFVVPTANPQAVNDAFAEDKMLQTRIVGNSVLIAATAGSLQRAEKREGKANPEWAKAFAKVNAHPSQVVILPPRVLLRAFAEVQPELPKELGGGSMAALVDALQWVSVGFDLSGKMKVDGIVQLQDEAAAKKVGPVVDALMALAKMSPEARNLPVLAKLIEEHRPQIVGDQLRLSLDMKSIDTAFLPLAATARENAKVEISISNLKQIALAHHIYHDKNKSFPPQASEGKDKKSLLSWRVQLLPFLEQQRLYDEFKHDEPWDSEHNRKLIGKMPRIYFSPLSKLKAEDGKTTYVVPAGPKLVFDGFHKTKIRQITDGTSNTILALDVDDSKAVIWTKPEDYQIKEKAPNSGHFRPSVNRVLAAFCDGSVRQLPARTSDDILWLYFCPADGNVIPE